MKEFTKDGRRGMWRDVNGFGVWAMESQYHLGDPKGPYSVEFGIVQPFGEDDDGAIYGMHDSQSHEPHLAGDQLITGSIKWDGCCNWSTPDGVAAHFCEVTEAATMAAAFYKAYEMAKALMPRNADF